MNIKKFFSTDNKADFWLHVVIAAFILWAATGLISLLEPEGIFLLVNETVGGMAPCIVLAAAILSILEKKEKRGKISVKRNTSETVVLFVFFCLMLLAQIIAVIKGTISYGVPVTLAGVAVEICIRTAGKCADAHNKPDMKETMKILFFGTAASIILGKFISYIVETLR